MQTPPILEFPELEWTEGTPRPAIEVSIDFLPKEFQGDWHRVVHALMAEWLRKNRFKMRATIWMWGCVSANMISRHPNNPQPSWSDFLIQFGLPTEFLPWLEQRLAAVFERQAGITEVLPAVRENGWTAICHVEQERVWTLIDADTWAPLKEGRKLKKGS